jgi:Transposase DDE domain group 1
MQDCATTTTRFDTQSALALQAAFDGGRISSDGGLVWLSKMDSEMGLCEAISECVKEWRKRKVSHSLASLVKQRVFQIACGYEDQNYSDTLREDPLLKMCVALCPKAAPIWPASPPSVGLRTPQACAHATR